MLKPVSSSYTIVKINDIHVVAVWQGAVIVVVDNIADHSHFQLYIDVIVGGTSHYYIFVECFSFVFTDNSRISNNIPYQLKLVGSCSITNDQSVTSLYTIYVLNHHTVVLWVSEWLLFNSNSAIYE